MLFISAAKKNIMEVYTMEKEISQFEIKQHQLKFRQYRLSDLKVIEEDEDCGCPGVTCSSWCSAADECIAPRYE